MERIDVYPTHRYLSFRLRAGQPYPFGATVVPAGINFSVFSTHAASCSLVLFRRGEPEPWAEIPFFDEFRLGNVFAMTVFDVDPEKLEYGFRMDGPYDPAAGHRFDRATVLLDPYAKLIRGRDVWGQTPDWTRAYPHRAQAVLSDFDWEHDCPLDIPIEDLVIYELHVRGFTRHPSSGVKAPGTFAGMLEKIPHLKALGVNCVELLPIHEFDEHDTPRTDPHTGERLRNYWGYNTIGFFAPKAGYALTGAYGMQVDELKHLVKQLHANGIEVILDVVLNHTAEGDERGPTLCYRGIDNRTYYMLTPDGRYFNFSGTGNTLNCNHPVVRSMLQDCLRYWAAEYHIDGFRFDLAAILGRDQNGAPLANPPLLEQLAFDPILAKCKLIAEAWDAGGLYQVGAFPAYGRWAEWNGRYRDAARRFLKGDLGLAGEMAQRLVGSPDLYPLRGPGASINFITCHDGFTLADLVSYDRKHNEANGEGNADGADDNHSWNCGWEGPTDDPAIAALRRRLMKNAAALLMLSRGVPMMLMGDEVGRTQQGNNNAYCQDNERSWLDWSLVETNADLLRFFRLAIALRRVHPVLRGRVAIGDPATPGSDGSSIAWHGTQAGRPDRSPGSRTLAAVLSRRWHDGARARDDTLYVAINAYWDALPFEVPPARPGTAWHVALNTAMPPPQDIWEPGREPRLDDHAEIVVGGRSLFVLVSR